MSQANEGDSVPIVTLKPVNAHDLPWGNIRDEITKYLDAWTQDLTDPRTFADVYMRSCALRAVLGKAGIERPPGESLVGDPQLMRSVDILCELQRDLIGRLQKMTPGPIDAQNFADIAGTLDLGTARRSQLSNLVPRLPDLPRQSDFIREFAMRVNVPSGVTVAVPIPPAAPEVKQSIPDKPHDKKEKRRRDGPKQPQNLQELKTIRRKVDAAKKKGLLQKEAVQEYVEEKYPQLQTESAITLKVKNFERQLNRYKDILK